MMVQKTVALVFCSALIFLGGILSPLFADYARLNEELDGYVPPVDFQSPDFHAFDNDPGAGSSKSLKKSSRADKFISDIKSMKSGHENRIREQRIIDFLPGVDRTMLLQMSKTAEDQQAVAHLVGSNLKLDELELIAGLRNPSVKSAQKKVAAELESFSQVMNLDDNLKQYSAFTEGLRNKTGPLKMKESIRKKYPSPGLTALKGSIIQHQVAALIEKMNIAQKNSITELRKVYWKLVFIEDSIQIKSETIDAFSRLKDVASALYRSGRTSFQDIIKINIKVEILKEDLITLAAEKQNVNVEIRKLLNLPVDAPLGRLMRIDSHKKIGSIEKLYLLARQERQELKVIRYQIGKVRDMIEMAESMIQEPFTLNFSVFEDEAINSVGSDAVSSTFPEKNMAAMKNNSPVKPWYGIDSPWLNQTRQNLLSLKQTLIKQENQTDQMVRSAWFMVDKTRREYALLKDRVLPLSKSALEVSTREYETGSIPFSQAIGSYTDWLNTKLSVAKRKSDLGAAIADLEKIIGKSF